MILTDKSCTKILVQCDCGVEIIEIEKFDDCYILSVLYSAFYIKQDKLVSSLKNKLKMIWSILRGKEYRLFEIILTRENINELKKAIGKLTS